ncbi:hypothetical protein JOC36_000794 [Weissella uvarum]|uniref:hypothetical protein n=1 Tax=Weissella uvarum TaxID=1479233 RepID=UPI0019602A62|nr:hypothetical protein [Weissella uvarum]MBM7617245.1 hypothetical protein [Weissella uvarum]MCM0595165.1 hypothetical protein [Weissella uvarum]
MTKKVYVFDNSGNPAYAMTHAKAIEGEFDTLSFIDDNNEMRELSVDSEFGLMLDGEPISSYFDVYSVDEIDELFNRPQLISESGKVFNVFIDDNGKISTQEDKS